jgi:flagellar L-ring protein precursor FlgH
MGKNRIISAIILSWFLMGIGCATKQLPPKVIPSIDYVNSLNSSVPRVRFADGITSPDIKSDQPAGGGSDQQVPDVGGEDGMRASLDFRETTYSPSLWRESNGKGGLFHDFRAWKPMDLITIIVSEISEGKKEADTNVRNSNSVVAAISKLLGIETSVVTRNTQVDPTALIDAETESQYRGQGATVRKGSLRGTISGMVMEVLPSGILRIEGKKIISVNNEEQVMVLSGLVRVRDIDSFNRVQSSQIANMRIDYFGNGVVNDVQGPGFLSQLVNKLWPF